MIKTTDVSARIWCHYQRKKKIVS